MGTPEYRAYEAIPAEGIAQETLREKIGFDKDLMKIAFSNGVKKLSTHGRFHVIFFYEQKLNLSFS